jgi:hypothetical protein
LSDYQDPTRKIVEIFGEPAARDLLRLLESDDVIRTDAFRQFHERGGHEPLLDVLTDLEADPVIRGWLVEHLRLALERRRSH